MQILRDEFSIIAPALFPPSFSYPVAATANFTYQQHQLLPPRQKLLHDPFLIPGQDTRREVGECAAASLQGAEQAPQVNEVLWLRERILLCPGHVEEEMLFCSCGCGRATRTSSTICQLMPTSHPWKSGLSLSTVLSCPTSCLGICRDTDIRRQAVNSLGTALLCFRYPSTALPAYLCQEVKAGLS